MDRGKIRVSERGLSVQTITLKMNLLGSRKILKLLVTVFCVTSLISANSPEDALANEVTKTEAFNAKSRQSVIDSYLVHIKPNLSVPVGWTGDAQNCIAGSSSKENKNAELATLNFIRTMAGLSPVKQNATMNRQAQAGALIGEANNYITHKPRRGSFCYTTDGYKGANRGNLFLSFSQNPSILTESTGARAVVGYMTDIGSTNNPVGHRRWLLYSRLTEVGLGDTNRSNNIVVMGGKLSKPKAKWVSWPTAGYFPRELEPQGRWSLSYPNANFKNASVSVKTADGFIKSIKRTVVNGYGDNTIAWDMKLPASYSKNNNDYAVTVTVSKIKLGNKTVTKTYSVTLVDADTTDNKTSNPTPEPNPDPEPNDPDEPTYQPVITPEMTLGYIRPEITFLGATSCTAVSDGWRVTISWKLSGGNFIGLFYDNNSGLRTPGESWIISTHSDLVRSEAPTGVLVFRTEGDLVEFFAMNGGWQIIDQIWFSNRTEADVTGLCH